MFRSHPLSQGQSTDVLQRTIKDVLVYNLYWKPSVQFTQAVIAVALCIVGSVYELHAVVLLGILLFLWAALISRLLRPLITKLFSAANHTKLGAFFLSERLCDVAIAHFSKAIALAPRAGVCYVLRAQCYLLREEHEKALADGSMALHLEDDFPRAHYVLGLICDDVGRWKEAQAHFDEAIRLTQELETREAGCDPQMAQTRLSWKVAPADLIRTDLERYERYRKMGVGELTRLGGWHGVSEGAATERLSCVLASTSALIYGKIGNTLAFSDGNFLEIELGRAQPHPVVFRGLAERMGYTAYTEDVREQFIKRGKETTKFWEVSHVGTVETDPDLIVLRAQAMEARELLVVIRRAYWDYLFARYWSVRDIRVIVPDDGLNSVVFWAQGEFCAYVRPVTVNTI